MFGRDDPVPPLVIEAGKASLGWRRLDAELAELLSDSALPSTGEPVLARGQAELRSLGFAAGAFTIDLELHGHGAERRLLGQLSPPSPARIELQTRDSAQVVAVTQADRLGRFRLALPHVEAVRLRIGTTGPEAGAEHWTETSWIPL
jgi:hypothetical protein